jgi:hypothetical protein
MDFKEIEQFMNNLKSVVSCKIISDSHDQIQEIHILADSSRGTKQICRDVQSVLISKFNLDVDYKKISIAQINDHLTIGHNFRLAIKSVQEESHAHEVIVRVKFEFEENVYEGEASGHKTERNILRLGALASLKAVESAIGFDHCLFLEEIDYVEMAGKKMVTSAVSFFMNGTEIMLCGSAFVESSKTEAAVKATLCAINRRIARYSTTN